MHCFAFLLTVVESVLNLFQRVKDEKVATLVLDTDRWIGENFHSFNEAFKEKVTLDNFVQKELVDPFLEKVSSKPSGTSTIIIDERPQSTPTGAPSYPSARQILKF